MSPPTSSGRGRLAYIGHATVLVELDGFRVLTDPVLRRQILHLRRRVPATREPLTELAGILVSHAHYDHLDLRSLRSLGRKVPVVAPRGTRRVLRGFADVRELGVGDETQLGGLTVRAVPAVHESRRLTLWSAPSLGFVISGSQNVYFAGDTDVFEGMSELAGQLDVALVPVAGWGSKVGPGHLDPHRAALAVQLLEPRLAVPIHWGTLSTLGQPAPGEPPLEFRRHAAELAPGVEVRVLEPGEALVF